MRTARRKFSFKEVLLVADLYDPNASTTPVTERRDLECTDEETFLALKVAIESLGLRVRHCTHPIQLRQYARQAQHAIVLSIYGGEVSRNRMALVLLCQKPSQLMSLVAGFCHAQPQCAGSGTV